MILGVCKIDLVTKSNWSYNLITAPGSIAQQVRTNRYSWGEPRSQYIDLGVIDMVRQQAICIPAGARVARVLSSPLYIVC